MVTGVEIAGLVLGAIPLVISALEHSDDFVAPTKAFIRWNHHLRRLIRELYTIRASYDQAIRVLLKPCVELAEQATMMDNPQSNLWTEGTTADALRDRLGSMYTPLMLMMEEVSEILVEIVTCLNLPGAQQVVTTQSLAIIVSANLPVAKTVFPVKNFAFRQRVKFTMKKAQVKDALNRLEVCTTRLDAWSSRADKLHDDTFQSRSRSKFCASINAIQQNASRIYQAVSHNVCAETSVHVARLLLEQRLVRPDSKRPQKSINSASVARSNCFGLGFRGECHLIHRWLNSEVMTEEFSSSCTRAISIRLSVPPEIEPTPSLSHVVDICSILKQPTHPAIGFHVDEQGSLQSYSSDQRIDKFADQSLSLEAVLPQFETRPSLADVYGLSITLIASLFQLSQTPWLETKWCKKDISFPRSNDMPSVPVDLRYPYLTKQFNKTSPAKSKSTSVNEDCDNLLGLAVMLLEIVCGKPIEQRSQSHQMSSSLAGNVSDLHHAGEWLKEEKARGKLSSAFYQAILTCLQQYLNPDASFGNKDYCDMIKEKTLSPLEEEMALLLRAY